MTKTKIFIVSAAVLAASAIALFCYVRNANTVPDEKRFARILADVYTVDAIFQSKGTSSKDKSVEQTYHSLLSHYGLSKSQYDYALSWYSARPFECSALYERVVAILTEREWTVKALAAKQDSIVKLIEEKNDSLTTTFCSWKKSVKLPLAKDDTLYANLFPKQNNKKKTAKASVPTMLTLSYELDSLIGGKLTFRQNYILPPNKNKTIDTAKVCLVVQYADSTADTLSSVLHKRPSTNKYEVTHTLKDSVPAVALSVSPVVCSDVSAVHMTISELQLFYMPYVITDSILFDEVKLPSLFAY